MIGIGIIGAGRVCAAHAASAQALEGTRLVAVADVDVERAQKMGERFGCRAHAGWGPLLDDPEVDAVVVALPHWLHREATLDSLQAGKHVLLEKPMAMSVVECAAMNQGAASCGRYLMVAHSQHFFPVNVAVKRFLAEGGIGALVLGTDTWYKPFHEGVRPAWFLDDAQGGGMWSMNGSHMIDRMCFFTGDRVVSVRAKVGNPIFGLSTDMGIAFLEFSSGLCVTLMHCGFREGVNRFEAELTGTEGQLRVSGDRGGGSTFWVGKQGQWNEVPVPAPDLPLKPGAELPPGIAFTAQMHDFAAAIAEGRPLSIPGDYGQHVVEVLDACVESSRTGREVRLDTGGAPG